MKKKLSFILLLILILPLLASCHGKQKSIGFAVPDHFDDQAPVEIVFWAKNDTNRNQVAVYQKAIEGFQALYPNVTVNIRLYTDYGRIYNDVITNISTNTTPNVCITYPDHIATYLTGADTVAPLDDLMADPRFGLGGREVRFDAPKTEEIVPEFLQECRIGEHTYAMPYMRSTEALYVNEDYVKKLGYELPEIMTWDFIWEVSEKAMEQDADGVFKVNGQKVMIPFIYKSTDNMMISMLKQLDAPYSTDDGEILIFNDTTKEVLQEIYSHGKSRAFSTFGISSYPGNFLNAGQCIFAIDSTAGATWMGSDAPMLDIHEEQVVPFHTKVMPIPQFDPEHPKMISQGPSVCRDPEGAEQRRIPGLPESERRGQQGTLRCQDRSERTADEIHGGHFRDAGVQRQRQPALRGGTADREYGEGRAPETGDERRVHRQAVQRSQQPVPAGPDREGGEGLRGRRIRSQRSKGAADGVCCPADHRSVRMAPDRCL